MTVTETVETEQLTIEIDGQALKVEPGSMIIEAADEAGIYIPRFCYHKKLSIAANCRMCLVDVEKARKPTPACATPVTEGMVVRTRSEKALSYQKHVMEFLLMNHPLHCPVCDQGGECELQDLAMGYGYDSSHYTRDKREVPGQDIGPLVATDLSLCIHCTRCVRFGTEIAGIQELGMTGRGEHTRISSFLGESINSEMSGNVIDVCPVGALTAGPSSCTQRSWEMIQHAHVSPHDAVGSNLYAHTLRGQLKRVVPRQNEALNEVWLSDRDRFSYEGTLAENRLTTPMVKRNGEWERADWSGALGHVVSSIERITKNERSSKLGLLAGSNVSVESGALWQKLLRETGSNNLDYRLRASDHSPLAQKYNHTYLKGDISDISDWDFALVLGSDVRSEAPIIHHRLRQATVNGGHVECLNPTAFNFAFESVRHCVVDSSETVALLAEVALGLIKEKQLETSQSQHKALLTLADNADAKRAKALMDGLLEAKNPGIFAGQLAMSSPDAGLIAALVRLIISAPLIKGGLLGMGCNELGALVAGLHPAHKGMLEPCEHPGLNAHEMLTDNSPFECLFLLDVHPELESADGYRALQALRKVDCVVALSAFPSSELMNYADIILPIASHYECGGTYINAQGLWQHSDPVVHAPGDALPPVLIARELADLLKVSSVSEADEHTVAAELEQQFEGELFKVIAADIDLTGATVSMASNTTVPFQPMYATDALVRNAKALQATQLLSRQSVCHLSVQEAKSLSVCSGDRVRLSQGESSVSYPVRVDAQLPSGVRMVPYGLDGVGVLNLNSDDLCVEKEGN